LERLLFTLFGEWFKLIRDADSPDKVEQQVGCIFYIPLSACFIMLGAYGISSALLPTYYQRPIAIVKVESEIKSKRAKIKERR